MNILRKSNLDINYIFEKNYNEFMKNICEKVFRENCNNFIENTTYHIARDPDLVIEQILNWLCNESFILFKEDLTNYFNAILKSFYSNNKFISDLLDETYNLILENEEDLKCYMNDYFHDKLFNKLKGCKMYIELFNYLNGKSKTF